MPFELTTPGAILLVRLYGVFTPAELNQAADEVELAEKATLVALDRVIDLTAVEHFEVGFQEIFAFARRRSFQRFARKVKSAILVHKPVQFGIARVYEAVNENPQIEVRILRSKTKALAWFAEDS